MKKCEWYRDRCDDQPVIVMDRYALCLCHAFVHIKEVADNADWEKLSVEKLTKDVINFDNPKEQ
jgi:hypothetical protein